MLNITQSPWPYYSQEEVDVAAAVLKSGAVNYWTGSEGRQFEEEFSAYIGVKHGVALSNGTVALEAALRALDVGCGDEVVVPARTFVATASCVVAVGARPVFADVDINSGNLTAETVEGVLSPATKAIICVHLAGFPCEMDALMTLAESRGVYVVEDCAQAHGASYKGVKVGAIGHVAAWSFCQDKIMSTAGEGGMVTTNDSELWQKVWAYKDHGKSWDSVYSREHPPGFRWLHESFGTNWRMPEVQAAVGRVQLRQLPQWSAARQRNAARLDEVLGSFSSIRLVEPPRHVQHACYKHYVYLQPAALIEGWCRDRIVAEINALGAPCYQGGCSEVYMEQAFRNSQMRPVDRLPVAKLLGELSLMFLVHPTLSGDEIAATQAAISEVLAKASL